MMRSSAIPPELGGAVGEAGAGIDGEGRRVPPEHRQSVLEIVAKAVVERDRDAAGIAAAPGDELGHRHETPALRLEARDERVEEFRRDGEVRIRREGGGGSGRT